MTSLVDLEKALDQFEREIGIEEGKITDVWRLRIWIKDTREKFAVFRRGFESCAYVEQNGKPAFVCTTCSHYHGIKKGCDWKGIEK